MKTAISILLLLGALTACRNPVIPDRRPSQVLTEQLAALNLEHPEEDLRANMEKQDFRFAGIVHDGACCPGVQDWALVNRYGIRPIYGTAGYPLNERYIKQVAAATAYAEQYNRALLKRLQADAP